MIVNFNVISDTPNANGTIYPKDELKRAMDKYNEKYVKTGKALGEISQPKSELGVSLMNVAFKINEIEFEDDHWNAEIKILNNLPKGKLLQEIIDKNEYRIVTMTIGEITKNKDGHNVISNMEIVGVGIEPKENCA